MDENSKKSNVRVGRWVVAGLLAFSLFVVLPNFIRARTTYAANACFNNLRQIDSAKEQWALENNVTNSDAVPTWIDVTPYLGRGASGSVATIYCPADQTKQCSNSYTLGNLKTMPKCKVRPTLDIIH
jgi:hypothetical protein